MQMQVNLMQLHSMCISFAMQTDAMETKEKRYLCNMLKQLDQDIKQIQNSKQQ